MVIESRTLVGTAVILAVAAGVTWGSMLMLAPPQHAGKVEVRQIQEPSWAVEVKELGIASLPAEETAAR